MVDKTKEIALASFWKCNKAFWSQAYQHDVSMHKSKCEPAVFLSLAQFRRKRVEGSTYWALYDRMFCERKPGPKPDLLKVPEAQRIGHCGAHQFLINAAPVCLYHSLFLPAFCSRLEQ